MSILLSNLGLPFQVIINFEAVTVGICSLCDRFVIRILEMGSDFDSKDSEVM